MAENISIGIEKNNCISISTPDIVILGRGLAKALEPFIIQLGRKITAKPYNGYKVLLATSKSIEEAGIYGGAALFNN